MQKHFLKIILAIIIVSCSTPIHAQFASDLSRADSLFHKKRYTQSFEIYKSIFDQGLYTPSMLLKMAFVQEGLNRIAPALYYLSLYYHATLDESVQKKIEELAEKHRLTGYEFSQADKALSIYEKNRNTVSVMLAVLMIFMISIMYFIQQRGKRPVGTFIALVILMLLAVAHINRLGLRPSAIIASSNTYIMEGPSAGAAVVGIAEEGHRVTVARKKDVWVQVKWNGKDAYIKEGNLLSLNL